MPLPVEEVLPRLIPALQSHDSVVLEAPPGAGKTTKVPIALLDQVIAGTDKLLILEPRRIAARSAAERMAHLLDQPVGQAVGYRIRGESKVSRNTRIEVITEGVMLRMLQTDPSLPGIGLIVFDEFHERNIDADLSLSLAMYARDVFREPHNPLKLLVMSATLDGNAVAELLGGAPVIASPGRMFPVELYYRDHPVNIESIETTTVATVLKAIEEHEGDVLVFLPGKKEIRITLELLKQHVAKRNIDLHALHGDLSLTQQRAAVAAGRCGRRKIVLASAIAESSLTIEGVRIVVDSGLSRLAEFDPRTAMTRLATKQSSKASAEQRAGRAGRVAPGICYRLWTSAQHDSRPAYTPAEILQTDLAPLALTLFRFGVSNIDELHWLDSPPEGAFSQATDLLTSLGALQSTGSLQTLTSHGELMAGLPVHPRLAHMLIKAQTCNAFKTGCQLAAILSARDPLRDQGADINARLSLFNSNAATKKHGELIRLSNQLKHQFKNPVDTDKQRSLPSDTTTGYLIASAYPDRIAKRRNNGEYQLANGRSARLRSEDPLSSHEWLAVAHTGGTSSGSTDTIFLATELDANLFEEELSHLVEQHMYVKWPVSEQALTVEQQWKIGALLLHSDNTVNADPHSRITEVISYIRKKGLQVLPWTDTTNTLLQRIIFVRNEIIKQDARDDWPDVDRDALLASVDSWLAPWLGTISHVNHFAKLDMQSILEAMLPFDKKQQLDTHAPTHYRVPSGSRLKIDYSAPEPVLAVKLQEMLGASEHPSIGNGYRLKVSLLSPAGRQIQLTQDITGFWAGSYEQVKKDMKSRYPKHFWPDDPAAAAATSRTVKRRKT